MIDARTPKKVGWGETFYVDQSQLRSRTTLELRVRTIIDRYQFSHHIMMEITWGVPKSAHTYAASDEGFVPRRDHAASHKNWIFAAG